MCVCFLRVFFCCCVCIYVCVCGFFVSMDRVFLTGGGCVVPCSCTKDTNSIKQIVACIVCYSGSKYGTYFVITRVYCGFRPYKKMFLITARAQKPRPSCFSFYFLFSNFPPENGAKTCDSDPPIINSLRVYTLFHELCRTFFANIIGLPGHKN